MRCNLEPQSPERYASVSASPKPEASRPLTSRDLKILSLVLSSNLEASVEAGAKDPKASKLVQLLRFSSCPGVL